MCIKTYIDKVKLTRRWWWGTDVEHWLTAYKRRQLGKFILQCFSYEVYYTLKDNYVNYTLYKRRVSLKHDTLNYF